MVETTGSKPIRGSPGRGGGNRAMPFRRPFGAWHILYSYPVAGATGFIPSRLRLSTQFQFHAHRRQVDLGRGHTGIGVGEGETLKLFFGE